MNEKSKLYLSLIFLIICVVIATGCLYLGMQYDHKTIRGNVESVKEILLENGDIKYLEIKFDNRTTIDCKIQKDLSDTNYMDLTKHSELIIEFSRRSYFRLDDYWTIDNIIVVPEEN